MKMYWKRIEALPKVKAPINQVTPRTTRTLTVALSCTDNCGRRIRVRRLRSTLWLVSIWDILKLLHFIIKVSSVKNLDTKSRLYLPELVLLIVLFGTDDSPNLASNVSEQDHITSHDEEDGKDEPVVQSVGLYPAVVLELKLDVLVAATIRNFTFW